MTAIRPVVTIENSIGLRQVLAEQFLASKLFHSVATFTIELYILRPRAALLVGLDKKPRLGAAAAVGEIVKYLYRNADQVLAPPAVV